MSTSHYHPSRWGVGAKLTALSFALVGVIIAALVLIISIATTRMLETRARDSVASELRGVLNMVQMFDQAVAGEAVSMGGLLADSYAPDFAIGGDSQGNSQGAGSVDTGGKATPLLTNGGKQVNLDFSVPDRFTVQTGGVATVFVVSGEDFIRVSTSVKKEDGTRAIGTVLDRAHPAYPLLRSGSTYVGLATLFGRQFMTRYAPVKDKAGQVVAVLFVGVDISAPIGALKAKIKDIKIGETGHFYVLNAAPGKDYGKLVVHPADEGKSMLDVRDAAGQLFVKQMLEKQNGATTYHALDQGDNSNSGRERIVTFGLFKQWNWLIAGGTYIDEITGEALRLRNQSIGIGLAALGIFAALLLLVVRKLVTRPLAQARDCAMQIAEGDLTVRMIDSQGDEIGQLARAINAISSSLSGVVGRVRDGAEQIATASGEISTGNLDLCGRTEQQAANLAATASSMGQLTGTVRQNADNARQANELALNASRVAEKGGAMVARVVDTMESINQSSRRIADIISVIDGIAFQTNILALNAAVEAARAGEQGRGFAVVASEVRNLAQRSAGAAREIKELITASSAQVGEGSKLVGDAGATMTEVLASVARVRDIMADISAASAEQSGGIEHISRAIGEMDQVTQQNAALVEEASAAAEALKEQAVGLARAVGLFKLDAGAPRLS